LSRHESFMQGDLQVWNTVQIGGNVQALLRHRSAMLAGFAC
jgi:hypothetical protein